ncbi:signal peptidase I [bacterium]|jgi:signal peptidase I|nr:signal peptidase I [bacterium]
MFHKTKTKSDQVDKLENIKKVEPQDLNIDRFSHDQENILLVWAKKFGLLVFEIVKVVLISLAIILPVRMFLIQPFYVEGASMEPNFYDKEYLIIDEISYRFNEPVRGDVVVFRNPRDTRQYYIKRMIGLPGENVEIKSGVVFVDGEELTETEYIEDLSSKSLAPMDLGEDEYFVLGDNRMVSQDSRSFGKLDEKYIIGKVWFRGWPIDRFSTFDQPTY